MHNKHLIRLWMTLVFVAVASGAYLLLPDKTTTLQKPIQTPVTKNLPWDGLPANTTTLSAVPKKTPSETQYTNTRPQDLTTTTAQDVQQSSDEKNPINTTLEINGQKYSVNLPEKSTAYDAMIKLVNDKKITAVFKEFSGLGYFVDEIDGVKTDKNAGKYWIYLLNGKPAQTGISNYILKNNDSITWKYEVPQF